MNKGLIFISGFLLGAGAGGFAIMKLMEQQNAQQQEKRIESLRNVYVEENVKIRKELEELKSGKRKEDAEKALKDYSPSEEIPKEKEPKLAEAPKPAAPTKKAPYVITPEVFEAPDNPHRQVCLKYYAADGVVTRPDGTIMDLDDIDVAVGRAALTYFGVDGNEEDRVCVRNDTLLVDYEICLTDQRYSAP